MITWWPHKHDKLITWLLGQYRDTYNMIPTSSVCNFAIWNKLFYSPNFTLDNKRKTIHITFQVFTSRKKIIIIKKKTFQVFKIPKKRSSRFYTPVPHVFKIEGIWQIKDLKKQQWYICVCVCVCVFPLILNLRDKANN